MNVALPELEEVLVGLIGSELSNEVESGVGINYLNFGLHSEGVFDPLFGGLVVDIE